MSEGRSRDADRSGEAGWPIVNTHVHLPPNFSAFDTVEDAVMTAAREGVRVLGTSNFHDLGVYARFASMRNERGSCRCSEWSSPAWWMPSSRAVPA